MRGNRGTPSAPLDDDELDAKFRELVGPVLGAERTERLLATCWQFDELADVSELLAQTVLPMADPTPEIALVTGAGSGLGAVIAERLAAEGLTVAVNTRARSEEAGCGRRSDRAGGGYAFAVTANVTDPSAVRRMFDAIAARGRLRVLVNNASYRPRQRVQTITEEDWHQVRRSLSTAPSAASGTRCPP